MVVGTNHELELHVPEIWLSCQLQIAADGDTVWINLNYMHDIEQSTK